MLNGRSHDLPILVSARLLTPLGNAPPNSVNYFATLDVLELVKDRTWLAEVTNTVNQPGVTITRERGAVVWCRWRRTSQGSRRWVPALGELLEGGHERKARGS